MNLRAAFFKQAHSDYLMYRWLNQHQKERCHQVHYLQMACEKLAKAILAQSANQMPRVSHFTFTAGLKQLKQRVDIIHQLQYSTKKEAFYRQIDSLLPLAEQIEKIVPESQARQPNPEYPWLSNDTVFSPLDYPFDEILSQRIQLTRLQRLLDNLFTECEHLFASP